MKRRKPKAKEKMMKNIVRATAAAMFAVALMIPVAFAQTSAISGEVKKIDEGAGKITLRHGPAKSLGMDEPMTMVYRVKGPGDAQAGEGRRQSPIRSRERGYRL